MALPRKGLRGVEKTAETTAWTNSMAESGGARVRDHSKTHVFAEQNIQSRIFA